MNSILTFLGLLLVAFVILLVPAMVAPYTPKYGSVGIADFTDRVEIGRRTIIGGRNSSVWTHNWQRTVPVSIGDLFTGRASSGWGMLYMVAAIYGLIGRMPWKFCRR